MKKILLPLLVIFAAVTVAAQTTQTPITSTPAAGPAITCPSTATLDDLVKAIDTAVTGPADQDRTCFRDIFYPEARLIPVGKAADGSFKPHILTVDGWIDAVAKRGKEVLGESQIKVERTEWAHIVHLWSTYALTVDGKPAARGINSIQAVFDGKRWRIIEILWQAEDETDKVPAKFLPAEK